VIPRTFHPGSFRNVRATDPPYAWLASHPAVKLLLFSHTWFPVTPITAINLVMTSRRWPCDWVCEEIATVRKVLGIGLYIF
jgi:hypothetical protein